MRFTVPPPEGGNFSYSAESDFFSPSPDGAALAYPAREKNGDRRIFLRPLAALEARPLPGTDGARSPSADLHPASTGASGSRASNSTAQRTSPPPGRDREAVRRAARLAPGPVA